MAMNLILECVFFAIWPASQKVIQTGHFDNLQHCNTILECWEHVDSYTFSEMLRTFVFDKEIEKNTCPKKVAIPCRWDH